MPDKDNKNDKISLAMIGYVDGNGHPYSWSAIINGYDPQHMADSPYPVISEYLNEQPIDEVSIADAEVTHIWADDQAIANDIAETTYISNVVDIPSDVIGSVDGVIIPTDDGDNHLERVRPFIDADVPIFVDKPLATNIPDLSQFIQWQNERIPIASSSAMRYAPAVDILRDSMTDLGDIRWTTTATHKTWKRYGVHTLEPLARLFGPGFDTVTCNHDGDTDVFTITHDSGPTISIGVNYEMRGGFSRITLYGTKSEKTVKINDTYTTFKRQLQSVIDFVRKPSAPPHFIQTIDIMACVIAGRRSARRNESVSTAEIYDQLPVDRPV